MLLPGFGSEWMAANRSVLSRFLHWARMQYPLSLVRTRLLSDEAEMLGHITLSVLVS